MLALQIIQWLMVSGVAASVINGLVPTTWHSKPYIGAILKFLARAAATTPPDAKGTFKLPGGTWSLVVQPVDAAGASSKRSPDSSGHWPPVILGVMLCLAMPGCAGMQSQGVTTYQLPEVVRVTSLAFTIAEAAVRELRNQLPNTLNKPETMDRARVALDAVITGIDVARTSLAVYTTDRTSTAQCRVARDVHAVTLAVTSLQAFLEAVKAPTRPELVAIPRLVDAALASVSAGCQ